MRFNAPQKKQKTVLGAHDTSQTRSRLGRGLPRPYGSHHLASIFTPSSLRVDDPPEYFPQVGSHVRPRSLSISQRLTRPYLTTDASMDANGRLSNTAAESGRI